MKRVIFVLIVFVFVGSLCFAEDAQAPQPQPGANSSVTTAVVPDTTVAATPAPDTTVAPAQPSVSATVANPTDIAATATLPVPATSVVPAPAPASVVTQIYAGKIDLVSNESGIGAVKPR